MKRIGLVHPLEDKMQQILRNYAAIISVHALSADVREIVWNQIGDALFSELDT
jgi:hypothetical protein